jgi:catechol 2,3-dioxygenase-like lactoylglutathione lyase family enzyme
MSVPRAYSVVLDCPDPQALADFYARLLDWPPDNRREPDNGWATLDGGAGMLIEFQRAADYLPPTWPAPERQQMFHLDFAVDDLEAAHDRAVELGARPLDEQKNFRVYADPAGHPFCLCR